MTEIHRLVLKQHVVKDDVEMFAWDLDWNIYETDIEDAGAVIDVWRTDDEKTEIRLVDDRPIGMRYLILRGANASLLEQQVRSGLDVWSYPEAVDALAKAADGSEQISRLFAVVLTSPSDQDDDLVDLLGALAGDPDPEVRRALVTATGYRQWPALLLIVEELRRRDPDESVRVNAAVLLEGVRRHGD